MDKSIGAQVKAYASLVPNVPLVLHVGDGQRANKMIPEGVRVNGHLEGVNIGR
jgi:hypothetical protein